MDPTSSPKNNSGPSSNKNESASDKDKVGKASARSVRALGVGDKGGSAKKVSYAPDTVFYEDKPKIRPHSVRPVEREKGEVVTTRVNDYQRREMLHRLAQGTPEDLQAFSTLFKQSQCRAGSDELNKLMDAVLQKQASLSTKAVIHMLKTYLDCQIDVSIRFAARSFSTSGDEEWYFQLTLEQLRECQIEGFSLQEIKRAKQEFAAEIASVYGKELPERWEELPSVSNRIWEKAQEDREAVKKQAEDLLPVIEQSLYDELKPEVEQLLAEHFEMPPEKLHKEYLLNTLEDVLRYVESPLEYFLEEIRLFFEEKQCSDTPIQFPKKVQRQVVEMVRKKYFAHR